MSSVLINYTARLTVVLKEEWDLLKRIGMKRSAVIINVLTLSAGGPYIT